MGFRNPKSTGRMWKEEGEKHKVENHKNTLGNVTVPKPAVWEIKKNEELEGDQQCGMVEAESQVRKDILRNVIVRKSAYRILS